MSELIRQLPAQPLRAEFSDVEQMCDAVRSWDLDFSVLAAPKDLGRVGAIDQRHYGPTEVSNARFYASIEQRGASPRHAYTFGVLGAQMRRLWWRGQDVDSGTVIVFPVGSELHSISGPDFEVTTISVVEETVAAVCERFEIMLPPARLRVETFHPPPQWLHALRQSLRSLKHAVGIAGHLEAQRLVERLVCAWLGPQTRHARSGGPSTRSRDLAIQRCLERIARPDWPELSAAVLCETGGVGERTLQYAFRERFGLTPAAFLKARRLAVVRERLLRADETKETVGDIAAALGFWHLGHFAADYRRAFGEVPSETLQRARCRSQVHAW